MIRRPPRSTLFPHDALPISSSTISWFPIPRIGRKTSRTQNIKLDVQWYAGLAECERDCGFRAGSDFRKLYLLSFDRDFARAIENSPELVALKSVRRNILPGF